MSRPILTPALLVCAALAAAPACADLRLEERGSSLDSKVTRWIAMKEGKRAIVTRAESTGVLYNAGARYGAYVEIQRPDRELIWELEPRERSYREITADEFTKILQRGIQGARNANDQPLRSLYAPDGATTAIEVVPTGKEKTIAGFRAEQVIARAVVGVQNRVSGNRFSFTFDQEIWLTKEPAIVKEVQACDDAYADAFGSAVTLQQARVVASEWSDAFITHVRAMNDRVRALGGVPLAVTTTVTEEAIAQGKDEKGSSRKLTVSSMEIRKITVESIPDSEFELPVGYINADTKVAVAPPAGSDPQAPLAAPPAPAPAPAAVAAEPMKAPEAVSTKPEVAAAQKPKSPSTPQTARVEAPSVVTPAPTNVIVAESAAESSKTRRGKKFRPDAVRVDAYTAPPITNNIPLLSASAVAGGTRYSRSAVPPPITVDEPESVQPKKKRKKR
jgi:hypothetical protein